MRGHLGPRANEECPALHLRQSRSTAFFVGVRVSGVSGRYRDNAHAVRARLLRWVDWLRLLKRALVARGLTKWRQNTNLGGHFRQSRSTAFFVGVRVSGVGGRYRDNAHAVRARLLRSGDWLSRAQAGSCGSRSNEMAPKHKPWGAFAPVQVNGILRRRARFWGKWPLPRQRARRQSPLASVGRLASRAQAGSCGSRSNEMAPKHKPWGAFAPGQVNGILRRRARFWGKWPLPRQRARRHSPLASVGRLAVPAQAGSCGSRSNCGPGVSTARRRRAARAVQP